MKLERRELLPGVFLNTLQTEKFKTDCLSLSLLTSLDRETVSRAALLPRVLARGSVNHPDLDAINAACDTLYGARILPVTRKKGEILAVGFYAGFLADRFTPEGERLLEPVSALLCELLLTPDLRAGALRQDYVENEREKLIDDIRGRMNDKRSYAAYRLIEQMFAFEAYGCDDMGSEEGAEAVDSAGLTAYYKTLLRESPIEIFYCGAAEGGRVAAALAPLCDALPRGTLNWELGTDVRLNTVEAQPRYFDETMEVGQGKLCLGFRLGDSMAEPDFPALRVFNALYGGTVTSKLFLNVREKLSLCYYASSALDWIKGALMVFSGIEEENREIAQSEILAQLEEIIRGQFSEEDLHAARKAVAGDLRTVCDSPGALENFFFTEGLLGLEDTPEELAAQCEAVDRARVMRIAGNAALDAVYFLHGDGEDADEEVLDAEA